MPILLLIVYLIVTGFSLNRYPLVWVDEGWIGEVAAQAARGLPLGSPSHGTLYRYEDRIFWMPPLYFYELGGVFRLAGVDLLVGRWFNVFIGGLSTLALFAFLRRRVAVGAALSAALFFAFDTFVWKTHRTIRFESLLTLFGVLLFISVIVALEREESARPASGAWVAAGLIAGLALNVHPNAILLITAMLVMATVRRGWSLFRRPGPWLALTVAFSLALPYLLYLWSDSVTGFANVIGQNSFHLDHGVTEGWAPLREWRRWSDFFVLPWRLPMLAAWLTLIGLALMRAAGGWVARGTFAGSRPAVPAADDAAVGARHHLLVSALTVLGVFVTLLLFLPNKTLLYLASAAPFVAVLGAALWHGEAFVRWPRLLARLALTGGIIASLAVNAGLVWRHRDCHAAKDLERIRAAIAPEERVAGTFVTWWATQPRSATLPPRPFHEFSRGASLEAVQRFGATSILLGDRQWQQEVSTRFAPLNRELIGSGGPLIDTTPTLEMPESCLGPVRLYSLER